MTTKRSDRRFEIEERISKLRYWSKALRPSLEPRCVKVDLPAWIIQQLDRQAGLIGVTRQSITKVWLSEQIKEERTAAA